MFRRMYLWGIPMRMVYMEQVRIELIWGWVVVIEGIHHGLVVVMSRPAEPLPVANYGGMSFERCAREDDTRIRNV